MSVPAPGLPEAAKPFVGFPTLLRAHGFAVAPEQTVMFLQAVALLGPRSIEDVRRAGRAALAPPPTRREEFDALFDAFFLGRRIAAPALGEGEEEDISIHEPRGAALEALEAEESDSGARATSAEALSARRFEGLGEMEALRRFQSEAKRRLPVRRARRRAPGKRGDALDLRRALRQAVRRDGELTTLPRLRRVLKQRRILLLIDISGSMSAGAEGALRFAHALVQTADQVEVFTFGTRLTRLTRPLRLKHRAQALAAAGAAAPDWDGGTRIGGALSAFLSVPRYAGFARGALVVILSDGLERGDPTEMIRAVEALSRRAWRLHWLTPLAADPGYQPRTSGLAGALAHIDHLGDGADVARICAHLLGAARAA